MTIYRYNGKSFKSADDMTESMNLKELYALQENLIDNIENYLHNLKKENNLNVLDKRNHILICSSAILLLPSLYVDGIAKYVLLGFSLASSIGGLIGSIYTYKKSGQIKAEVDEIFILEDLLEIVNKTIEHKEAGMEIFPELIDENY